MAYVSVPNDLSKIKTKMAFNLTKRQLLCFSVAAIIGIPTYLFTRSAIGLSTFSKGKPSRSYMAKKKQGSISTIIKIMAPVPPIVRSKFLWPSTRPYQTQNFYAYLSAPRKEVQQLGKNKKTSARSRKK